VNVPENGNTPGLFLSRTGKNCLSSFPVYVKR
jgi:hypothetical protein